jgi:hypothetical protein
MTIGNLSTHLLTNIWTDFPTEAGLHLLGQWLCDSTVIALQAPRCLLEDPIICHGRPVVSGRQLLNSTGLAGGGLRRLWKEDSEAGWQYSKRIYVAFLYPSRHWMAFSRVSMYVSVLTILCASRTASVLLEPVQYVL